LRLLSCSASATPSWNFSVEFALKNPSPRQAIKAKIGKTPQKSAKTASERALSAPAANANALKPFFYRKKASFCIYTLSKNKMQIC
jgi:hypothetical protein